jgi:putative ABC transport system permease protein
VIIIGQTIVARLFPNEAPLGKLVKVSGKTYTVIGTFAERGSSFGNSQDGILIIPITRFVIDFGRARRSINIAIQAPSQDRYNETLDKIVTAMRIVRGLRPEQENDFEINKSDKLGSQLFDSLSKIRIATIFIGILTLIGAGIGLMNIMLVSVNERTREIGVSKAIGAKKRDITMMFLCESILICLIGGSIGVVLGTGFGNGVSLIFAATFSMPWGWMGAGIFFCFLVGLIAGIYPALKAGSLNPVEALRYE